MKKFYFLPVFILTAIIFQFSSCDEKSYTVTVKNESSKPVIYSYNGERDGLGITDGVDNSKQYIVGPYTPAPKDIDVDGVMNIKMLNQNGENFTFVNIAETEVITLYAVNTLPIDVVLRNGKYIDFNGSIEMPIPAGESKEGKLYTSTVNFTLYPSQYRIDFSFNEERTAINVTIRE